MEWRLLGPLEVLRGKHPVDLGGRQRRTLLAVLAVHAGEPISTDRIVDELWGDSPPAAARKTVQAHVAHLRKVLNGDREVLTSSGDGYQVWAEAEEIDARRFEKMVGAARETRGRDAVEAAEILEQALQLFRGAPLAGLADNAFSLRVEAERLSELRLGAIEDRLDALVASGETQAVAAEAERLLAEHPLRERLWSILMLALHRSGRQAEALRAYSRLRQTLAEELGIEPSRQLQELEQRMIEQDPSLIEIRPTVVGIAIAEQAISRNPYKGLRAFDEADASDFFGRTDLVRHLVERVESRGTDGRLTFLAGPSGSGKSSVVRAGLVPHLRDRHQVGIMLPGDDPMAALAKALSEATDEAPDDALASLLSGDPILADTVIVIDQFEETYTLAPEHTAAEFLALLARRDSSVRWVATIRADFLDRLMTHPTLGTLLDEALVLIPPLQEHEIRAVVTRPAERVNVAVEPELVAAVTNDVQARPAALPLLQYALTDAFERRRGDVLTVVDYERSGGITGALARRAEDLYSSLRPEQQLLARLLFLQLVTITEDGDLAKVRIGREGLLGEGPDRAAIHERFGSMRLLTFDQEPDTGSATVEIAHEALMSEWPRLAAWIEEARDDLRLARRLAAATNEWQDSGRDPSFLLTGARLAEMESWLGETQIPTDTSGAALVTESRAAEDSARNAAARRRRAVLTAVSVAAVGAAVLAVFAFDQADEARHQTALAEEQTRIATVRQLAASSLAALDTDPELAILLALRAVETSGEDVLPEAEEALHRALLSDTLLYSVPNGGNGLAHFAPDGNTFIAAGEDPTTVQIWGVDPVERLGTLTGNEGPVLDAVFDRDGDRIASTSLDGTVRIWDVATGEPAKIFTVEGPPPLVPVFSWDGALLAASSDSGTVFVWDVETEELIWELPPPPGTLFTLNLDFSPDGSLLAVAPEMVTSGGAIHVWNLTTGTLEADLVGHDELVKDVGFSPDGETLVSGSWDTTLRVWSTETWETGQIYFGHESSVWDLQVSSDGTLVASSGNNEAVVWDLQTGETLTRFVAHDGIVDGVDLSPDHKRLLTGSFVDRNTRVWDITSTARHELLSLPGSMGVFGSVAFSPDGETLAASRGGRSVTIWEFPTGRELPTYQVLEQSSVVDSLSFHPDGSLLAFADREGAGVIDLTKGEVIPVLR